MENGKAWSHSPRSENRVTEAVLFAGFAGIALIAGLLGMRIAQDEQKLRRAR